MNKEENQKLLVSEFLEETQIALIKEEDQYKNPRNQSLKTKNYTLLEFHLERPINKSQTSAIYLGKVQKIIPGLQAAFVDIGNGVSGFLYKDQVVAVNKKPYTKIENMLKEDEIILVQIIRDSLKTKGPKLTMDISLAGRNLVYKPLEYSNQDKNHFIKISKKLPYQTQNDLKKSLIPELQKLGSFIIRTAAYDSSLKQIKDEAQSLLNIFDKIDRKKEDKIGLVYDSPSVIVRLLRDLPYKELNEIIIDNKDTYKEVKDFLTIADKTLLKKCKLYKGKIDLLTKFNLNDQLNNLSQERVDLDNGGYLIIDPTEALTIIDINSGSFKGKANLENTLVNLNLQAAQEIARQIRLRDIGGIIVIDFVDMKFESNRIKVFKALSYYLRQDRSTMRILPMSDFCLVQLTRKSVFKNSSQFLLQSCPVCSGDGTVLSDETLARKVLKELYYLLGDDDAYLVEVPSRILETLTHPQHSLLTLFEKQTASKIFLKRAKNQYIDSPKLLASGDIENIITKSFPGNNQNIQELMDQEFSLHIMEPHMYNENDAISFIGNYPISITDGYKYLGKNKMVKISKINSASARAEIIEK